jgi:16S rRNA (guanine527-N7)-methyltransferase
VTSAEFERALTTRATANGLAIDAVVVRRFETYYRILTRWNGTINLTSLPLDPLASETIDRLLIEPLAVARLLPELPASTWFDLGSGGGSPALPMLLTRPELQLTMVEVRERKAAFLREAVRTLGVRAVVETARFEDVAGMSQAGLVTVRAIKIDEAVFATARRLLRPSGLLVILGRAQHMEVVEFDELQSIVSLEDRSRAQVFRYVPRGTSSVDGPD